MREVDAIVDVELKVKCVNKLLKGGYLSFYDSVVKLDSLATRTHHVW